MLWFLLFGEVVLTAFTTVLVFRYVDSKAVQVEEITTARLQFFLVFISCIAQGMLTYTCFSLMGMDWAVALTAVFLLFVLPAPSVMAGLNILHRYTVEE